MRVSYTRYSQGSCGQGIIEYFILLVVVAALTIFATSKFFSDAKSSGERAINAAVNAMAPETEDD